MLVHGEGDCYGQPFKLRAHDRLFIYEWFEYELDADGNFRRYRYDQALRELAKGGAKTEVNAAIALAEFAGPTAPAAPNIPVGAASFEQADLLFGRAKQMATHDNAPLKPFVEAYDTELLLKGRPGRMFRIAAQAGTNDGGLPTLFVCDEVHEWVGRRERVHLVVSNSVTKRNDAHGVLNGTTPGWDLKSLAGRLHTKGVTGDDPRFLHQWITADPALDLQDPEQLELAVRQANPWATDDHVDRLVRRFAEIPEHEFRRYHLSQWAEVPEDGWLADKPGSWESCEGNAEFDSTGLVAMAVDMSLKRDSTAVAEAQWREDGRLATRAKIWTPGAENKRIDFVAIKAHIRERADELSPEAIYYDPRFMEMMAQELADEGYPMVEFPQSPERMSPACMSVYDFIMDRTLVHDGDPVLAAHVRAAVKRETDRGWSLSKGKSKAHIDGCIAMVMAASEVARSALSGDSGGFNIW